MIDSPVPPPSWSLLRCPSCGQGLSAEKPDKPERADTQAHLERALWQPEGRLRCVECAACYPVLLGIPLLVQQPDAWLSRVQAGLARFVTEMDQAEKQLLIELLEEELSERTRGRVRHVAAALAVYRSQVVELFARAGLNAVHSPEASGEASSPVSYVTLIHRDYGWEPEEAEFSDGVARLRAVLPHGFTLGRSLVLGAGTGRLAWQLAEELGAAAPLFALDLNPLPFIVTALLLRGEEVRLTEVPGHPRRSTQASLERTLRAPARRVEQLSLVFADALSPPFAEGSFDTIIAPWFVDQVPEDAADVPRLASRLLREGGSFVCTGPFVYEARHTKPSRRYCADEFVEIVRLAGFETTGASYEPETYLASPLSTQSRNEHVLYLHARKQAFSAMPAPSGGSHGAAMEEGGGRVSLKSADGEGASQSSRALPGTPAYLKPGPGAALPIPPLPGLGDSSPSHPVVAEVAALIDGQRSLLSITDLLVKRGVVADDGAADAVVRACLRLLLRQAEQS